MGPGRPLGDTEVGCDLPVRESLGDPCQDIALASGQGLDPVAIASAPGAAGPPAVAHPSGDDPRDGRIEMDLARRGRPDGAGQLVGLGILEQEARRPGLDRGDHPGLLDEAGQRDDLGLREDRLDAAGRLDAVDHRHHQVHHDDVRPELAGALDGLGAIGGLADDHDVVVELEEIAHPATDHRVVVDEEDPDRGVGHRGSGGP